MRLAIVIGVIFLTLVVFSAIVGSAIALKAGWRPSKLRWPSWAGWRRSAPPLSGAGHGTSKRGRIKNRFWWLLGLLFFIFLATKIVYFLFWVGQGAYTFFKDPYLHPPVVVAKTTPTSTPEPTECTMPCTLKVGYETAIWASGKPFWVKFKGVGRWVYYKADAFPCEHPMKVPWGWEPGYAEFKPGNEGDPIEIHLLKASDVCQK